MEMGQLAPAASEAPQVFVAANAAAPLPPSVMPVIVSAASPVFLSTAVCAALVVPVCALKLSVLGATDAAGAGALVAVPVSVAVCGDPAALSVTVTVALKVPVVVGEKITRIRQLPPAASELPQVFVVTKLPAPVPESAMLVIASAALPVLESVIDCPALTLPDCVLKVSDVGERAATGAVGAVPVPVRATVCGDPVALSATESVAEKLAAEAGLKITEIVQSAPTATELPQVFVSLKSAAFVPVMLMPLIASAAEPILVSVTLFATEFVPVVVFGKASDAGLSDAAGPAALIVKFTALEAPPPGAGLFTVTGAMPALAISAAGIAAVTFVALTYVVVSALLLKLTVEPLTNPVPVTVSENAAPPAVALDGLRDVIVGAGLEACTPSWLTVNVSQPAVIVSVRDCVELFWPTA